MNIKEFKKKLAWYEQIYFSLDEPVPFKGDLKFYPVLVKDYYLFYSNLNCITQDKSIKIIADELGNPKKVSNPIGIGQSYLEYLISRMEDKNEGPQVTSQLMSLFELVFHEQRGMYCPHCGTTVPYSEFFKGYDEYIQNTINAVKQAFVAEHPEIKVEDVQIPKEILDQITQKAQYDFFAEQSKCKNCGEAMREKFSIKKESNGLQKIVIKDIELGPNDIDELRFLIPRQNILDYSDDEYLDPDLKEELEIKAQLQNSDYSAPTLEKSLVCIAASTGFTFEYLKTLPMRKLNILLRTIDRKETYYAQLQASMSGMVKFKEEPKHWIFGDDKKNIKNELTNVDEFTKKFDQVT